MHTNSHQQAVKSSVQVQTWSGMSSTYHGCYPVQNKISKSKFQIFARYVQALDATLGGPPLTLYSESESGPKSSNWSVINVQSKTK